MISRRALRGFWEKHSQAETPLTTWYKLVVTKEWKNFVELQMDFPSADYAEPFTIFNIGGNKYRLIAAIHYNTGMLFVRHVFTHGEYDEWNKGKGKK